MFYVGWFRPKCFGRLRDWIFNIDIYKVVKYEIVYEITILGFQFGHIVKEK